MNRLNFNFEVKSKKNGSIVVAGFANAATIDRAEEIIDPKAWRLDNYKKNPIILFDHGMDLAFGSLPVGKAIKVEPREEGLYCEVEISNSKTEKITAVRDLVEEGILKTFSVGFDPKNSAKEENIKRITDAELLEISFVPIPMNQDSTFSMLSKSLSDSRTKTARRWWDNYKKNVQREIVSTVKKNSPCGTLELLSLIVQKEGFESLEKAKKFLAEKKYSVEKIDESDNCWKFIQKHVDNVETIEIDLTPTIKAIIKGKKMEEEEKKPGENEEEKPGENDSESSEEEKQKADDQMMQKEDVESAIAEMQAEASACANNDEGNPASWVGNEAAWAKAKEAADQGYSREDPEKYWAVVTWLYLNRFGGTVKQPEKSDENSDSKGANDQAVKNVIPTGSEAVQETVNPQIDLSKQTNVLLGVVIDQLQKLNMSMEKMVEVPIRVDEQQEETEEETREENRQENRQQENEEEDDEEMKKAIRRIRENQEDLNLRLKSLIY